MIDRVRLSLRVPEKCVDEFVTAVIERYGCTSPYAGVELEREMELYSDRGPLKSLHNQITTLSSRFDAPPHQKKNLDAPAGETQICQFRVSKPTRAAFMDAVNHDDRAPGHVVGALMHRYATAGGVAARERDRIGRTLDVIHDNADTGEQSPAEKIADNLGPQPMMRDIDAAIKEAGYESVAYAKESYLSDVLEVAGLTWHPDVQGLFTPVDNELVPATRDPRTKPYVLMNEADKKAAIVTELRERLAKHGPQTSWPALSPEMIISVLQGRPQPHKAHSLAQEIADDRDGWAMSDGTKNQEWDTKRLRPPKSLKPDDDDEGPEQPERQQFETEADEQMQQQMNATPEGQAPGHSDD